MGDSEDSEGERQGESGRESLREREGGAEQDRGAAGSSAPDDPQDAGQEQLVRDMGAQAEDMQDRSDQLAKDVASTRSDWERRQADETVPGAVTGTADPTYGGATPPKSGHEDDAEADPGTEANKAAERGGRED